MIIYGTEEKEFTFFDFFFSIDYKKYMIYSLYESEGKRKCLVVDNLHFFSFYEEMDY
jgi:hypothetical protein